MSDTATFSGSPSMVSVILVVAFVVGVILSLANSRVRPYVLGLVGVAVGVALATLLVYRARVVVPGQEIAVTNLPVEMQRVQAEHLAAAQRAQVEHLAEIVRNQRTAARMADAVAQLSPDETWLETYPDGMQIKQDVYGHRTIVREADLSPQTMQTLSSRGSHQTVIRSQSAAAWWILGAPIAVVLLIFMFLRNRNEGRARGRGVAVGIALSAVLLLAGGFVSIGGSRVQHTIATPPMPHFEMVNAGLNSAAALAATDDPFGDKATSSVERSSAQVDSIEAMWNSLTGPVIKLELETPVESKSREELAAAARTILAASAPGADPFTQGWLTNAAKAILKAAAEEGNKNELSLAEAMDEPIAQLTVQQHAQRVQPAVKPAAVATPIKPDWINNPPQRVGNTQRVVVTTDPYSTAEECELRLHEDLLAEVRSHIADLVEKSGGVNIATPDPQSLGITPGYILAELCPQGVYMETLELSVGPMKRAHALLEFNDAQDQILLDRWSSYARQESMAIVALLAATMGGCLSLAYGLLRIDTWTRGYYSKRLFIGVPAAIIAAGVMFSVMVAMFG